VLLPVRVVVLPFNGDDGSAAANSSAAAIGAPIWWCSCRSVVTEHSVRHVN
jgi:hypothetical protein